MSTREQSRPRRWACSAVLWACACNGGGATSPAGTAGATEADPSETGVVPGSSDGGESTSGGAPSGCEAVPRAALRRMHRDNYVRALESVFGTDVLAPIAETIGTLPPTGAGIFATEVPPVGFAEVSAYFDIADALAFELTTDPARLVGLRACLGAVPAGADAQTDPCLVGFIDEYGLRLLRRPLADDDRARFAGDYAVGGVHSAAEGVSTLLIGMLLDPRFLYFTETDGEEVAPGIVTLTDHELAARLARVLWDSVPDDALLAAANAGLDDATVVAEVERMLDDARAREAIARFASDWLGLGAVPQPSAALFPDPEARETARADMRAELLAFIAAVALDPDGTYADLLLDRSAVVASAELAQIYGVEPGDAVTLPAERAGLLTRAAWLATPEVIGSNAGHIIKRGKRLAEFLCRPVPPPDPANFPADDPAQPVDGSQGIRARFQDATAAAECVGCHVVLDGHGAPFGHFGAAGQWIDREQIELDGGPVELDIDVASMLELDDAIAVDGALELSAAIAEGEVGPLCLADRLVRNVVARPLEDGDACLAETVRAALAPGAGGGVRDALVALVTSEHFRQVALP